MGVAPCPEAAADSLLAGRFRAVRLLGEGTMGQVFEAVDTLVGDRVAVKRLRREWISDPEAVERSRREVQAARQIAHPNVCRVFDLAVDEDAEGEREVLLVMELIRGETLAARLARGPLAPEEALPIVRQLAAGLDAAHAAGVVHRDLKPANVLLEPRPDGERVVLTDFGLARCLASTAATLTAAGDLVGSPAYLAPEQVLGQPPGPAADVFSLGVVLYELLTGALPFDGETGVEAALARLHGPPPPPSQHVSGLDPRWDRAVLACLALEPERRFRDGAALLAALDRPAAPPAGRTTVRRAAAFSRAALLAVVLLATGGASTDHAGTVAAASPDLDTRSARGVDPGATARASDPSPVTTPTAAPGPRSPLQATASPTAADLLAVANDHLVADDRGGAESLYQDALAAARSEDDRVTIVRALTGLGIVRAQANDLAQAERMEREALDLARRLDDPNRVADLLNNLGFVVVRQGRLPEAEKLYREAAALYGETGVTRRRAAALNNLAILLGNQGYLDEATVIHRESLTLRRRTGDRRGEGVTLLGLGRLAARRNLPAEARSRLAEALRIFRASGYSDGTAEALTALAEAALAAGDPAMAGRELDEAEALSRRDAYPRWLAEVARVRALAALDHGAVEEAIRQARESLRAFEALFDGEGRARAGVVLARSLVAGGHDGEARTLLARLGTWEWIRQDRSLRLSLSLTQARLDRAAGAVPVRLLERLESTADEASRYGLRDVERRARQAAADLDPVPGFQDPTVEPMAVVAACRLAP